MSPLKTIADFLSDEPHPWISITLGALNKGALADTVKRFQMLGSILALLFYRKVQKLIADTQSNENMAIDLVTRYSFPSSYLFV